MKNILLLEDEELIWSLYKRALKTAWYNVTWIKSIFRIKNLIKKYKFDVIFLDYCINWKKYHLKDILKDINDFLPNSYLIILSNYSNHKSQKIAFDNWAYDYLTKFDILPNDLVFYTSCLKQNVLN